MKIYHSDVQIPPSRLLGTGTDLTDTSKPLRIAEKPNGHTEKAAKFCPALLVWRRIMKEKGGIESLLTCKWGNY